MTELREGAVGSEGVDEGEMDVLAELGGLKVGDLKLGGSGQEVVRRDGVLDRGVERSAISAAAHLVTEGRDDRRRLHGLRHEPVAPRPQHHGLGGEPVGLEEVGHVLEQRPSTQPFGGLLPFKTPALPHGNAFCRSITTMRSAKRRRHRW